MKNEIIALDLSTPTLHVAWGKCDSNKEHITEMTSNIANNTTSNICSDSAITDTKLNPPTNPKINHSETLGDSLSLIQETIKGNYNNVFCIVVSLGPGSFTGLRVAMSFARGIQAGNQCTLIGIDTMNLWSEIYHAYRPLLTLIDARSNKFYCKFHTLDTGCDIGGDIGNIQEDIIPKQDSEILDLNVEEIISMLHEKEYTQYSKIYFAGPSAALFSTELQSYEQSPIVSKLTSIQSDTIEMPNNNTSSNIDIGAYLLKLGLTYYNNQSHIVGLTDTPIYVRNPT